ncbi:MAG: guanylate kinase [Bacillota bacterium]|nr:guanylate kinase [Bacillota bacterium]
MSNGLLIVLTGPSGVGKGTVLSELLKIDKNIKLSVSATTRTPRTGEKDGCEYYFMSKKEFEKLIDDEGVLEYAEYCGNYYGTPRTPVFDMLNDGKDVILEIEVQGARQVRKSFKDCVSIFIMPPSHKELCKRLEGRGTEDKATVEKRMNAALSEIKEAVNFDYVVVNDKVPECVNRILGIIQSEKLRAKRNKIFIKDVLVNA